MLPSWFQGFRPGQQEVVEEILEHYRNGAELVVADCPTGTGKTIIGAAVAEALELQTLYLCSSLTLQEQFRDDFDQAAILMGRSNYLPHLNRGGKVTCADCDKSKRVVLGETVGYECSFCDPVGTCSYEVAKGDLLSAPLGCTNIRYFLTEANNVGRLSRRSFVILDEADVIEQELMSFVEARITSRMRKWLNLPMPDKKTKPEAWVKWFELAIPRVREKLDELRPADGENIMARRRHASVLRLLESLRRVQKELDDGWVYDGYQYGEITFKPIKVDKYAKDYLWAHGEKWLAMSATIISPEEFVSSLGFEGQWATVEMPSPFDPARRPIRYIPAANMVKADEDEERPKLREALEQVITAHPDERVLVHTNSYSLANYLRSEVGSPRVRAYLDAKERADAIKWFEETPNAVLLASSLDRGYDGSDDLCRVVVICKVPFPYLGDKQIQARLYQTSDGGTWYAVQTARSLVQMSGRGMRHEDDWCTVYVLDKQFGKFWRTWKRTRKGVTTHRLLPSWFCDAIVWGSSSKMGKLEFARS